MQRASARRHADTRGRNSGRRACGGDAAAVERRKPMVATAASQHAESPDPPSEFERFIRGSGIVTGGVYQRRPRRAAQELRRGPPHHREAQAAAALKPAKSAQRFGAPCFLQAASLTLFCRAPRAFSLWGPPPLPFPCGRALGFVPDITGAHTQDLRRRGSHDVEGKVMELALQLEHAQRKGEVSSHVLC